MNYDFLISKLPQVMRQDNILNLMKSAASILDALDNYIDSISKIHVIEFATGKDLDLLGSYLGIVRDNRADDSYRRLLKIYYYSYYFVPNANNFLFLIKNIMGYLPEKMLEGWLEPLNPESCVTSIDVVIPSGEDDSFLIDLDKVFSAGCRLNWRKLQEAYLVTNSTSTLLDTGIDNVYDEVVKIKIGKTLGTSTIDSTKISNETSIDSPKDIFVE